MLHLIHFMMFCFSYKHVQISSHWQHAYAVRRMTCTPESLSTSGLSSPGWSEYVASWSQLSPSHLG